MKVIYTYTDGTRPVFVDGSNNTLRILIVFYDDLNLYVYYCNDDTMSVYLNRVIKKTVVDQALDISMLNKIESDEEFDYYIKWIENNYNYNGVHVKEKITGSDNGKSGLVDINGKPLV